MHGQRISIRIITTEYLVIQRTHKYEYEVISPGSKYFGNVDEVFSDEYLKAGHHYEVKFNKSTVNPVITRALRELER